VTTSPTADEITEDWRLFTALNRLGNHWDRPGWSSGRRSYHWMLTFENAPELQDLASRCQEQLRLPVLDLVPLDGLHLTLQRVAFTDQISTTDLDRVIESVANQAAGLKSFPLTVGPVTGSSGAVRFSVGPWEPVVRLRESLLAAIARVLGPMPAVGKPAPFRPHVGIAYCNSPTDAEPIVSAVAPLRQLPPAHVAVDAAVLVELRREGRAYRWDSVARLPFGGPELPPEPWR
jgi:2'-5' RNA ligase